MSNRSIYFIVGKRIGYWFASHKDLLKRQLLGSIIQKLPGGKALWRFFR